MAKQKILVVDDDEADLDLFKLALSKCNIDVDMNTACNGEEALENLRGLSDQKSLPSLVFLDLNMPGKNGREVLAEMKADANLKTIPVIVFTSSDYENDVRQCYDLGCSCYLRKPSSLSDLRALLEATSQFWFEKVIFS
ncbi:MAG: response regulator [Deltaproteobacteria bacterium]|nr:response regulator [Deltaproteobacteria bacterium]